MLVSESHEVAVDVDNVFSIQGNAIPSLVFLADALRKKPVQNRKIDVTRLQLPTVKLQVSRSQAVLETVEFDEPAVTKRSTKMLSAEIPDAGHSQRVI
jgi:hypothetical protein